MIDEHSPYLQLPLPDLDHLLEEDVLRLRESLLRIDAHVAKLGTILASDNADLDTIRELVAAIQANKTTIDQLLTGKADAEAVNTALSALERQLQKALPNFDGVSLILQKDVWKINETWLAQQISQKTPYFDMETGKVYYPGYAGQFKSFQLPTPPENWMVCTGGWLDNADVSYQELWRNLNHPAFATLVVTNTAWTEKSTVAGGVGGVPFFVVDAAAKRIRLPDTRGDYTRAAGSSYLQTVGGWHEDAFKSHIHRITSYDERDMHSGSGGSLLYWTGGIGKAVSATGGLETRTRAYGTLGCVCVGPTHTQPSVP